MRQSEYFARKEKKKIIITSSFGSFYMQFACTNYDLVGCIVEEHGTLTINDLKSAVKTALANRSTDLTGARMKVVSVINVTFIAV